MASDSLAMKLWTYISTGTSYHVPFINDITKLPYLYTHFQKLCDSQGTHYAFTPQYVLCASFHSGDRFVIQEVLSQLSLSLEPLVIHYTYLHSDQPFYMILPSVSILKAFTTFHGTLVPEIEYDRCSSEKFVAYVRGYFQFDVVSKH